MGCYISKANAELRASIEIDGKQNDKKMLSMRRKAFFDEDLSANETFSKKALCWYDLEMQPEDFEDKADVTKIINEWAASSAKIAKEVIDVKPDNDFPLQPLAGHTGLFATDKVEFRQNCNFATLFMNVDTFSDHSCCIPISKGSMETWAIPRTRYKNGSNFHCVRAKSTK